MLSRLSRSRPSGRPCAALGLARQVPTDTTFHLALAYPTSIDIFGQQVAKDLQLWPYPVGPDGDYTSLVNIAATLSSWQMSAQTQSRPGKEGPEEAASEIRRGTLQHVPQTAVSLLSASMFSCIPCCLLVGPCSICTQASYCPYPRILILEGS